MSNEKGNIGTTKCSSKMAEGRGLQRLPESYLPEATAIVEKYERKMPDRSNPIRARIYYFDDRIDNIVDAERPVSTSLFLGCTSVDCHFKTRDEAIL